MGATDTIFFIAVLIMSVVIHEVSHGYVAEYWGDSTARFAGRLTLNPIKHLDLFGSIILPAFLILSSSPVLFGWAKPVPYNPANLTNVKWGTISVASAGVLANFLIAIIFGFLIRIFLPLDLPASFLGITSSIVITNLVLGIFNLVPIPPLDGSKILFSLLPGSFHEVLYFLERYGFFILILFIVFFSHYLYPILSFLYGLLVGIPL